MKLTLSIPKKENKSTAQISIQDLIIHIMMQCKQIDCIIACEETLLNLRSKGMFDAKIVKIAEYHESNIENKRRSYLTEVPPLDELSRLEIDELFLRSFYYSKRINLYDKMIGQANRISNCYKGLKYILELWLNREEFFEKNDKQLNIYTFEKGRHDPQGNKDAYHKLCKDLVEPLKTEYGINVNLFIKKDSTKEYHARHLESDYATITLDRGIDLFKGPEKNQNILPVTLNLRNLDGIYLSRYRKLPDMGI